jgi:hypothetical protein
MTSRPLSEALACEWCASPGWAFGGECHRLEGVQARRRWAVRIRPNAVPDGSYFDGYRLEISVDADRDLLGAVEVLAGAHAICADWDGGQYQAHGEVAQPPVGADCPATGISPLGEGQREHAGLDETPCTDSLALPYAYGAVELTRVSTSHGS